MEQTQPVPSLIPFIAYHTPALWREANASIAGCIQHHRQRMEYAKTLARQAQKHLQALFPLMDDLCRITCPKCRDVCCRHACVWIDFKDLLFLHLTGVAIPEGQLLSHREQRCRYGTPQGCCLQRIQRPFICTWYLCPAQTGHLRKTPQALQHVQHTLQTLKQLRAQMEDAFIHAAMG